MNLEKLYESKYLNGKALADYLIANRKPNLVCVIESVTEEDVFIPRANRLEKMPVLRFRGMKKSIVWGKNRCRALVDAWGFETAAWHDKTVRLCVEQTSRGPSLVIKPGAGDAATE